MYSYNADGVRFSPIPIWSIYLLTIAMNIILCS